MKKHLKKKINTTKVVLIVAVLAVMVYTVAAFYLQLKTGSEISPTLTESFFHAMMVELVALSGIKISKVFKGSNRDEIYEEEFCEEEE